MLSPSSLTLPHFPVCVDSRQRTGSVPCLTSPASGSRHVDPTLESTERGTSVNPTLTQGTGYDNGPFGLEQRELLGTGATTADDIDRFPGRDLFGLPGGDSFSVDPESYSSFNEDTDLGKRDSADFFKNIWYGLTGKPRRELHSDLGNGAP